MNLTSFLINRHKILILFVLAFLTIQQFTFAQSSEKLSSQQIFEETVKYYDSTGIWDKFSGKMYMTSLMNGNLTPQEISITKKRVSTRVRWWPQWRTVATTCTNSSMIIQRLIFILRIMSTTLSSSLNTTGWFQ